MGRFLFKQLLLRCPAFDFEKINGVGKGHS